MQDIRKPYSRSKSSRDLNLSKKVEAFESHDYEEDVYEDEPVQIPVKRGFKERRNIEQMEMFPSRTRHADDGIVYRDPRTRYESRKQSIGTLIFIGVLAFLIGGGSLMTFVFNKATVTITPKHQDITDFRKAITFAAASSDTDETVLFTVATSSLSKEKTLSLSETKKVEAKASGKILIYNAYSSDPQRLIKNTRFASSAGKIYRINQSVVVPGKKGTTPGSVEVTVYADDFGADYNSAPTDFTIPGFAGTPQFAGFYARSNGPLTGGASGNASLASISDINAAKDELALFLAQKLKESLAKEVRAGYVGLYSAVDIVYEDNEQELLSGQTSVYKVKATGYLMFAKQDELAKVVAQSMREYNGEDVRLDYTDKLSFTKKDTDHVAQAPSLEILVEGAPRVVFLTNEDSLRSLVAGKKRSDFTSLMRGVNSIEGAEISFSPLWLSTFPSEVSKIDVVESLPKR